MVSESRVMWATSVPILVFLGLCSRVRPDVCDRQTDVRQKHHLMPPPYGGGGIIKLVYDSDQLDDWLTGLNLTASPFNQGSQYTSSPGRRGY